MAFYMDIKEVIELTKTTIRETMKELIESAFEKEYGSSGWLSIKRACKHADISYPTLQEWLGLGLPLYKINGTKRINIDELDSFIRKNRIN